MGKSEIPPPPALEPGQDPPHVAVPPPGPESLSWLVRYAHRAAPMGPKAPPSGSRVVRNVPGAAIVFQTAKGVNVIDVDGNRYVDLAAGFGSLLLGHDAPAVRRALELQSARLLQAMGDVHPSDARIALTERAAELHPDKDAQVVLGQSGADAVSIALKTAVLATGRAGVLAFSGAYHGLSYGPLAALGLRPGYRVPFAAQLNPHVEFAPYPSDEDSLDETIERVRLVLSNEKVGAVLVEPILGRGGVIVPPDAFLPELARLAARSGALLVADEIWTGLGRSGHWLRSTLHGVVPDLICLGKGLGGGLPLSACIGRREVMQAWAREPEVVHTSTFTGAPLACATAIATLDTLRREDLVTRSRVVGAAFRDELRATGARARGEGLMLGIDLDGSPHAAVDLVKRLLGVGFITSTGGGEREVLVLTPPLTISAGLLSQFSMEVDLLLGRSKS